MMYWSMYVLELLVMFCCSLVSVKAEQPTPPGTQKMSFKPPQLDDEAQWSEHMPSTLTCEGCKAVAYTLNKQLWNFHESKHPKHQIKPESDTVIAVEEICLAETFKGYGVKNVNGHNKLSGPGLNADSEAGMLVGGGKWPSRLSSRCGELLGEFDEYDLYKMVAENKGKEQKLFNLLCKAGHKYYKRNTCGNGFDELLEPKSWSQKTGDSYTTTPVEDEEIGRPRPQYPMDNEEHDEL